MKENKMTLQEVISHCAAKPGTTQEFPFDDTTLVFKVLGKMYGLVNMDPPHKMNLKCDPVYAQALRKKYEGVTGGYHMNKKHWNTVALESDVPAPEIKEWIDDSYNLVMRALPKAMRAELTNRDQQR